MVRRLLLTILLAAPCFAQARAVEVFAQAGRTRLGEDEGSLGGATSYGGALMIPLTARLALDVDGQTMRRDDSFADNLFRFRRTLFTPGIVYRGGSGRVYGFAGGGLGGQFDRSHVTLTAPSPGAPAVFEYSNSGFTLHGKAGVVGALTPRLLIRGDVFVVFRYVLPSIGARIGIGYRF